MSKTYKPLDEILKQSGVRYEAIAKNMGITYNALYRIRLAPNKLIFGVMKAQGISSRFIANSVIAQTFILAVSGVTIGLLATIASALILPEAVPFQTNLLFFGVIALLMVLVAINFY